VKHKILFNAWADASNVNAQNLNARDIACRFDPAKYDVSMFYRRDPDPRLAGKTNVRLVKLPGRLASLTMLRHLLLGYDAVFYMRMSRADSIYRRLRAAGLGNAALIAPIESPVDVLDQKEYSTSVRSFYDEVFALADQPVANSEHVAKTVLARYGVSIPVVHSGVDTAFFRGLASEAGKKAAGVTVMFAGSLQERKHPELVLDAARLWPDVRFVLMGDGALAPLLSERIREEAITNAVMVPTQRYAAYARELVKADIFLFPSRVEGLGKVLLEASAAGVPAIVFDDYRAPMVIDGVTGYQTKSFEEMKERLGALITGHELRRRMGRAAMDRAQLFDWEEIVRRWEVICEKTIEKKQRRGRRQHEVAGVNPANGLRQ